MRTLTLNHFGHLETAILEIFWIDPGSRTVAAIHSALHVRGLAYTTIRARPGIYHDYEHMVRMTEKGWLSRTPRRGGKCGRSGVVYLYTVRVTRGVLLAAAIKETCSRLRANRGNRAEALAVLLDAPRTS